MNRGEVTVSWTSGQGVIPAIAGDGATAVPTLSFYASFFLALLVAVVLWRAIKRHPRVAASAVFFLLLASGLASVGWVPEVRSGGPISITPGGGVLQCTGSDTILDDTTQQVVLNNQCGQAVTVTYDASQSACGTVEGLQCRNQMEGCVEDGGEVAANETRYLLDCSTS
jgi:hypothetical protein